MTAAVQSAPHERGAGDFDGVALAQRGCDFLGRDIAAQAVAAQQQAVAGDQPETVHIDADLVGVAAASRVRLKAPVAEGTLICEDKGRGLAFPDALGSVRQVDDMNAAGPFDACRNPALKHVIITCSVVLTWIALDLGVALYRESAVSIAAYPEPPSPLRRITAYLLPAFGVLTIAALARFARQGRRMASGGAAIAGLAFILSGAGIDLTATLLISPDLEREGNPYVRALLDSGHSLRFVYAHLAITQAVFILLFCTFWIAFLRHLPLLMETIASARPASRIEFLKASTGAAHLTLRQWLLPLRPSEVPILYHNVWAIAMSVIFGVTLFRWYAALEWLERFEPAFWPRALVLFGGLSGSLLLYFVALACVYRLARPQQVA